MERRWIGLWLMGALAVCAAGPLALAGCGDDDDPKDAGADDGDAGDGDGDGDSGDGDSGDGDSGDGDSGDGDSGDGDSGDGDAAGDGDVGGDLGGFLPMAECDADAATTATCGGTECPAVDEMAATLVCARPCCLPDDTCGSLRAYADNTTDCAPQADPDPACPDFTSSALGMETTLTGCCAPSGKCGALSTLDGTCITSSTLLTELMPGDDCDADADAGM